MTPKPCPDCGQLPSIVADESNTTRIWEVSHRCQATQRVWRGARSMYKNDAIDGWNAQVESVVKAMMNVSLSC